MKRLALVLLVLVVLAVGCAPAAPAPSASPTGALSQPSASPTGALSQPSASPTGAQSQPSGEPIKIGFIGAMTGTNANLGEWAINGIKIAVNEKNAAGGIKGRPVTVIYDNDEADPSKAVTLAQKQIEQDKVIMSFACTNSTPTLAVVPIFQKAKVPHITWALNMDVTKKGSAYVFRSAPDGSLFETSLVDLLVSKGYKKFAIITDTSAYGKGESDYEVAALKKNNLEPVTLQTYELEDKDFTGQLTKIMALQPEVLLLGGSQVASGLIAKSARTLGFKGQFAGVAVGDPKYVETAGVDAAEGSLFSVSIVDFNAQEATKAFFERYKAIYNVEPEMHPAQSYDAMTAVFLALENAYPDITPDNVATQMHKICGMKGLQGEFCYQASGDALKASQIGIIKGGKLTLYK